MSNEVNLETVVIPTGRTVTKQTAWWYLHTEVTSRDRLYCIHNKNLLEGCNACRKETNEA